MGKVGKIIVHLVRELSALILAIGVGIFFWQFTGYEPENGMWALLMLSLLLWGYMFIQGGSLAFGVMGSSVSLITDILMSALPLAPTGYALLEQASGDLMLSTFQTYTAYLIIVAVLYDLAVNGGLMARINRYMNEYHNTRQ